MAKFNTLSTSSSIESNNIVKMRNTKLRTQTDTLNDFEIPTFDMYISNVSYELDMIDIMHYLYGIASANHAKYGVKYKLPEIPTRDEYIDVFMTEIEYAHGLGMFHKDLDRTARILLNIARNSNNPKLLDMLEIPTLEQYVNDYGMNRAIALKAYEQDMTAIVIYLHDVAVTNYRKLDIHGDLPEIPTYHTYIDTFMTDAEYEHALELFEKDLDNTAHILLNIARNTERVVRKQSNL